MTKPRARDLGLDFSGETGALNAITDVPGVMVGACTRIEGEGPVVTGKGPVRTGVTAILPRGRNREPQPVWAGIHALNGNGEMTGSHWVQDGGYFIGPVCITNTHNVGIVHHAATRWIIETYGDCGARNTCGPCPSSPRPMTGCSTTSTASMCARKTRLRRLAMPGRARSPKAIPAAAPAWSVTSSRAARVPRHGSSRWTASGLPWAPSCRPITAPGRGSRRWVCRSAGI